MWKQQALFNEVKGLLLKTDLRYEVVHPAKLRITFQNKTHSVTQPAEAMDFYKKIKPTLGETLAAPPPS